MLAGSTQDAGRILHEHVQGTDPRTAATVFGPRPFKTGSASAALVNGTSGHALDWDDTQLATSADRIFGLLTHPTMPPLVAALAVGEPQRDQRRAVPRGVPDGLRGRVQDRRGDPPESLQEGLSLVGHDRHVRRGRGGGEAARPRRGADGAHARDRRELGVRHPRELRQHDEAAARRPRGAERRRRPRSSRRAASRAARTRSIRRGASSRPSATAKATTPTRIIPVLGKPHTIVWPGVSIKPYPCGVLGHPTMDAMRRLVHEARREAGARSPRSACARARTS